MNINTTLLTGAFVALTGALYFGGSEQLATGLIGCAVGALASKFFVDKPADPKSELFEYFFYAGPVDKIDPAEKKALESYLDGLV